MKKLNRLIFKERTKNIIISLIELLVIFLIAYLFDKWFEMLIFVLTYNLIRCEFLLQVHGSDFVNSPSKSIILCRIITFIVQFVSIIFLINIDISKFINTFLACILGIINYLSKFYIQRTFNLEIRIRNIDSLKILCENAKLSETSTHRMIMKYVEKKTYREIADIECVDEEAIKQSIKRSRKKIGI